MNFIKEKPLSDTMSNTAGDDDVIVTSQIKTYTPVVIEIKTLEALPENTSFEGKNVFIEYEFCGEVEDCDSLPFPTAQKATHFGTRKEFHFKVYFIIFINNF